MRCVEGDRFPSTRIGAGVHYELKRCRHLREPDTLTISRGLKVSALVPAALLARLRSERGPGRSSRGARFWRELFADLESASREDDISWEVVFAVTEAVQAEVCRTARLRAVMNHRPDAGLLARVGTRFSRASTPGRSKVMRWSSRRARAVLMSAHSSAELQEGARAKRPAA